MPKLRSLTLLIIAEIAAMSLWFVSAAVVVEMASEAPNRRGGQGRIIVCRASRFRVRGVWPRPFSGWPTDLILAAYSLCRH